MAKYLHFHAVVCAAQNAVHAIYRGLPIWRGSPAGSAYGVKSIANAKKLGPLLGAALAATDMVQANTAIAATIKPTTTPVVTITLSLNDDGTGNFDYGSVAIYASDTADNGGLASYSFGFISMAGYYLDSTGQFVPINVTPINNVSPFGYYDDGTGSGGNDQIGFTALRSGASISPVTAAQNIGAANTIPVFGLGQTAGNLADNAAPGSTGPVGTPTQPVYGAPLLLATCCYSIEIGPAPSFPNQESDAATVFISDSSDATEPATVLFDYTGVAEPPGLGPEPVFGGTSLPEPESLGLLLLGVPLLARRQRRRNRAAWVVESLERRTLLSHAPAAPTFINDGPVSIDGSPSPDGSTISALFTPAEMVGAYGVGNITLNGGARSFTGNGSGETIAYCYQARHYRAAGDLRGVYKRLNLINSSTGRRN